MAELDKPYLRKHSELDGFTIFIVDGKFVREHINREFTNFGQHFRYPFIPKYEFWIDKEYAPDESDFYINHLLIEWDLMSKGVSYDMAIDKADEHEKRERKKSKFYKKAKEHNKKIPPELYVDRLETYSDGLDVWIVSGELVRDLFYNDFTEGGHEFVYKFVPKNEVWIDDDLGPAERAFVILHELHERNLMKTGMIYDSAHLSSSIIEYKCRRGEKDLHEEVKRELNLNKEQQDA